MAGLGRAHAEPRQANDQYVLRLPTPPRTDTSPWTDFKHIDVEPSIALPFLQGIRWQEVLSNNNVPDWIYENRQHAQRILPFLYLGPVSACRDIAFLKSCNIDMVVTIRHADATENKPFPASLRRAQDAGVSILQADITSSQALISAFTSLIAAINNHIANATSLSAVLVCCETGNARSAALVVAYCIDVLGLPAERAMQLVQGRRFCISLDESLKSILVAYAGISQAKQDVSRTNMHLHNLTVSGHNYQQNKRHRDEDEVMLESDDVGRFDNRGFTPFKD